MDVPARPTPVVLLHSAGQTPQMWQSQVEAVAAGTQVIAPWLAGLRPGRDRELSLAAAAADAVSQLDRYGIERAVFVGHQLGAMVSLEVAVDEPDRVAGLVLSGAAAAPSGLALHLHRALIRVLPNRALADSGASKADLLHALDVIAEADMSKGLDRIAVATLVIAGAADPAKPAAQQLAGRIPGARFAEIPGAGATPPLESPQAYNDLLVGFLGQ